MQTTRAKFRCHQVLLTATQVKNPDLATEEGPDEAEAKGVPYMVDFNQPQVTLSAVMPSLDAPENERFFAASPQGTITITISNPKGAEIFEPGKSYYVDFTPAD